MGTPSRRLGPADGAALTRSALRGRGDSWLAGAWVVVLGLALLWPQRHPGLALGHDLVVTPHQGFTTSLGLSSAPPRAVPVDALVSLAEHLGGGQVVGRVVLLVPLLLAGLGAQRVLAGTGLAARLAAGGWAVWNPYVVERLALGQWALLWGYAAVPWLVLATARLRRGAGPRSVSSAVVPVAALVAAAAAASITPTGGVLAVVVVVAVVLTTRRGAPRLSAAAALVPVVLLQLPWILATFLGGSDLASDPASAAAFAARGELGGLLPTLLTGGGTWDAAVTPSSRESVLVLVAVVVVVGSGLLGRRRLVDLLGRAPLVGWVSAAGLGLLVALVGGLPGGRELVDRVVADVPGGGLLRDAQKWVAPLVALSAVAVGAAVEELGVRARAGGGARRAGWPVGVLAVLGLVLGLVLPLVLLPDASRVVWPTLTPVSYPEGYADADRVTQDDPGSGGGDVVALPFQPYRAFAWAGGRSALDPLPRLVHTHVVVDDRLSVDGRLLAGEDPRVEVVGAALAGTDVAAGLRRAGICWALVEEDTPGSLPDLSGLERVPTGPGVRLYRVPGPCVSPRPASWRVVVATTVTLGWVLAALLALAVLLVATLTRVSARPDGPVGPNGPG